MIPMNRSLVPLSSARRAALAAISLVEKKRDRNLYCADYPYARAFFRVLKGSKRVTLKEIRFFQPCLPDADFRGNKQNWLRAIDMLISSAGEFCPYPLSSSAVRELFPEWRFHETERQRRKLELRGEKYSRQMARRAQQRARACQAAKGQAEIDLAFHTPETVSSWVSRWSDSPVGHYELEAMFYRWSERFPSLKHLDKWAMAGLPLWQLGVEAGFLSKEAPVSVRELERWMVPNKLTNKVMA